jgi:hypothetical protein
MTTGNDRKEAGAAIDTETCEIRVWWAPDFDQYLTDDDPIIAGVSRQLFVRSPERGGWINEVDLPPEKYEALRARIGRE